jgi:hypothetical protein
MGLSIKLDDIKPLLGAVGLGQDPTPAPKDVSNIPAPPMPPPPTPAQAGFSLWNADPKNQQIIANSLTMPGTPITPPNTPPASPLSSSPTPPPPDPGKPQFAPLSGMGGATPDVGASTPNFSTQTKMDADIANNPDAYQKPMLKKAGFVGNLLNFGTAGLLGAAGGLKGNPGAGADWVAQQAAIDRGVPAANAATYDLRNVKPLRDAAQLADVQSQTAQRTAAANKADTQADDMAPFTMTAEQAKAINQPGLAGTQSTMRDYNKLVGLAGNNNTSAANNANTNTTKGTIASDKNATAKDIANTKATAQKGIADAANKTKMLMQSMRDQTSRANNENTVNSKGTTGAGGFKVPADVTKRAALASNVLENADAVDGIITKRPDIIGAMGGRYSNVQQMIGSDDPDIQALGVRMHNIALASNGAHGVRAQQAIQKTEDELFSNFKAGPNAIHGALQATRGSMQTFLGDEQNFSTTGKRTGSAPPSSSTQKVDGYYDPATKKVVYH